MDEKKKKLHVIHIINSRLVTLRFVLPRYSAQSQRLHFGAKQMASQSCNIWCLNHAGEG